MLIRRHDIGGTLGNLGKRKMTALLVATPTVPAPGSDWLQRIDDVAHDIIAAANNTWRRRAQRRRRSYKTI